CQAEAEEADGAFTREPATWYPEPGAPPSPVTGGLQPFVNPPAAARQTPQAAAAGIRRMPDGKPDLQGHYQSDGGGANYGIERHTGNPLTPGGRGVIVDPPDGKLPMQTWA